MTAPYLQFDFPTPFCFQNPVRVITVSMLADVRPALQTVQAAVDSGFYAAGYVSYEAAPSFDNAMRVCTADSALPLVWFGLFSAPIIPTEDREAGSYEVGAWEAEGDYLTYRNAIESIQENIACGNVYQVNHTFRLSTSFGGDGFGLYKQLCGKHPPTYSAYLNLGPISILSASPELFFHRLGNHIITRPMKGTRPRGRWREEDEQQALELSTSEKDRAENVMIVDLLRNDLGRLALPGTVQATRLFDIERYPTVWQMTSTIEAELPPQTNLDDIFTGLFPCGSVTGAPKISATQMIAECENSPREVYCGAIGYLTPQNEAVFNVGIRTAWHEKSSGRMRYGVGGGIVWDSTSEEEYKEAWVKAGILNKPPPEFDLLETLRWEDGHYALLDRHLARLLDSADYFGFAVSETRIREELLAYAYHLALGAWRVRLCVSPGGAPKIESAPLSLLPHEIVTVALAKTPVSRCDPFLCHKTTHRTVYERHKQQHLDCFDVLLWNEDEELTEFTIGNLVIEQESRLWTPPRLSGLLNGTMRAELLEMGRLQERVLRKEDLGAATNLWLINSVRGWVPVRFFAPKEQSTEEG